MVSSYKTIADVSHGMFKDKGSKFIALAYPISDSSQVKNILSELKKEYYDARHHCFAWRIGNEGESVRAVDDGEPSGTAGRPILGQLVSHDLTNVLMVVIRYFGGTKLGTSGLIRAYRDASEDAILNSQIVERDVLAQFRLEFGYLEINGVMKTLKDLPVSIRNQQFDNACIIDFSVRCDYREQIESRFENMMGVVLTFIEYN